MRTVPTIDEDGVNGLGREAPPPLKQIADDDAPKNRDEFARELVKQCARNMVIAEHSKELTEAIKAATALFQVLYPESDPSKGFGGKLTGGGSDGA